MISRMACRVAVAAALALAPAGAGAQIIADAPPTLVPAYSIWDVDLGSPVAQIDSLSVGEIACGTDGGPPGAELRTFAEWADCPPEERTGLHEIYFSYDDEQDYIARALEVEYRFLQGGTSVFANPVVVSILVDDDGLAQGIRIVTDDRISDRDRRNAVTLARNFQARYSGWGLQCEDIPPRDGEMPVGNRFTHEICHGSDPDGSGTTIEIEATYLRKRGQEALSRETQAVNRGYYESRTRFQMLTAAGAR